MCALTMSVITYYLSVLAKYSMHNFYLPCALTLFNSFIGPFSQICYDVCAMS